MLEPGVIDRIADDHVAWEREPPESLARDGQPSADRHEGFRQPADTLRDKRHSDERCPAGRAEGKPW